MRSIVYLLGLGLAVACSKPQPAGHPFAAGLAAPATTGGAAHSPRAAGVGPDIGETSAPDRFPEFRGARPDTLGVAVRDQNVLAGALYGQVAAAHDDNFALSPSSVALAFGMTYGGARGETARQMATALRYTLPQTQIHAAFGSLLRSWNGDAAVERPYELVVANRLFGEETFAFRDSFLGLTADHYQARLEPVDFIGAPEAARLAINGWVEQRTEKRIEDLLPAGSVKRITRLVLTNAVYFDGKWKQAFRENATKDMAFAAPGMEVRVPMMHLRGEHRYAEKNGARMLEMRYEGDRLAMQLVLPKDAGGLAALEMELAAGGLDALRKDLGTREVIVSLPRFSVAPSASLSLKKVFEGMGMTDAFDRDRADFGGMADLPPGTRLFIQDAFHKAFVDVREEGTEAAAATGVIIGIEGSSAARPAPVVFDADHPFVFVIRDLESDAILFMGRVTNPARR